MGVHSYDDEPEGEAFTAAVFTWEELEQCASD
jgi:hypothetical protein